MMPYRAPIPLSAQPLSIQVADRPAFKPFPDVKPYEPYKPVPQVPFRVEIKPWWER